MSVRGGVEGGDAGRAIRILVSSCLLGEAVRYDGGHKRDAFLVDTLGRFVEFVPVCPEVECGLPTPREAMRLAGDPSAPRLVTARTGIDHTARMERWIRVKLRELAPLDLCGYICKKDSPSSGMARVKVYDDSGLPSKTGAGIFTKAFMERFPLVPVVEEGRLRDPVLRELFIERVFTLGRYRDLVGKRRTRAALVSFHTDHKLLILSHGRTVYAEMGKLVARAGELPVDVLFERYQGLLMDALARRATVPKTVDVLLHMAGHLKAVLDAAEKRELLDAIGKYRRRLAPLVVPVTLIRRHARKHRVESLVRQVFLDPHPAGLRLRNCASREEARR